MLHFHSSPDSNFIIKSLVNYYSHDYKQKIKWYGQNNNGDILFHLQLYFDKISKRKLKNYKRNLRRKQNKKSNKIIFNTNIDIDFDFFENPPKSFMKIKNNFFSDNKQNFKNISSKKETSSNLENDYQKLDSDQFNLLSNVASESNFCEVINDIEIIDDNINDINNDNIGIINDNNDDNDTNIDNEEYVIL